jgi:hypothetical protein
LFQSIINEKTISKYLKNLKLMTFQEFMLIINEMKGDFGADAKPPKPNVVRAGTTSYAMLPGKKVCKFKRET